MNKFYTEKQNGFTICVNVHGNVDEYAKKFLAIYNNAREYPDTIAHVENSYDNRVYVTVYENAKERAVKWLSDFGEIKSVESCDIFKIYAEYPYSRTFFNEKKDSEPIFIVEIS